MFAVAVAACVAAAFAPAVVHAQPLPQTRRVQLDNGLTLLFRHNPAAETVAIGAFVKVPASCETAETAGIRGVVQSMLLHRPAEADRADPVQQLAEWGAVVSQSVQFDCTQLRLLTLAEHFDKSLLPLREILMGARFNWSELAAVRAAQQQMLVAAEETSVAYASQLGFSHLFSGTPCAWPPEGSTLALRRLRQGDVRRFYERYWRPNNVVLAVCGPLDFEHCRRQVKDVFGGLLPGADDQREGLRLPDCEPVYIHRPWPSGNAIIMMLTRAPAPGDSDYAAAEVMAAVVAGGQGSILWQALRQQRPLVYGMDAGVAGSNLCSTFQIAVGCDAGQAAEVFTVVRDRIGELLATPPTEAQVARAVRYVTGNYLLNQQSNLYAASLMGFCEVLSPGQGPELQSGLPAQVSAIGPTEVQQVAEKWLKPAVWVQIGGAPPGY